MRQSYTSNAKQRAERSSVFGEGRKRIRRKARAFGTQEQFRKHGRAQRPSPTQSWSTQPTSNPKNQPTNAKRGGMWNGRVSRRTQINKAIQENKTSAGIGTTVEHPPRERIVIKRTRYRRLTQRPSPTQKVLNNETG